MPLLSALRRRIDARTVLVTVCVAILYYATAKFGLGFEFVEHPVTILWPPAGIALSAILILGYRAWPGIALGAFWVNAVSHEPWHLAAIIAAGNTLEAVTGRWLLARIVKFDAALERLRDVLGLTVLGAAIAPAVAATVGAIATCAFTDVSWQRLDAVWLTWWIGDGQSILLIAPFLLTWSRARAQFSLTRAIEVVCLFTSVTVVSYFVLVRPTELGAQLKYAITLFFVWSALSLGSRVTATLLFLVAAFAIWGCITGNNAFPTDWLHTQLLLLQTFMSTLSVASLSVAAVIAERRTARDELHRSEQRFRATFNQAFAGMAQSNLAGSFDLVNQRFCNLLARPMDEVLKLAWRDVLHPEDAPRFDNYCAGVARTGADFVAQARFVRPDGSIVWTNNSVSAVKDDRGRPLYIVAVVDDITDRKRAESALARQAAELEATARELARSNADLERFAYIVSHDLQEPLRSVTTFVRMLDKGYKGRLDPEADKCLAFINDGATRMSDLIRDVLALARIGAAPLRLERVSLETLLQRALANLRAAIDESGAVITHDALPTLPVDAGQITQVFQNLVANAIKFRRPQPCLIHVAAQVEGREWVISVRDNGIGLDPRHATRIFELFQRLHARDEYPGTGVGLAICKKVIERHNGGIWMDSRPGEGAVCSFTLPLVPSVLHQSPDPADLDPSTAGQPVLPDRI